MVELSFNQLLKAVAINQSKRLGITALIQRVRGGRHRGGEDWSERDLAAHVDHVVGIFEGVAPAIGDPTGKIGVELGPGDDVAVAYCFLKAGAKKMYTIERFDSMRLDARAKQLFEALDECLPKLTNVRTSDVMRESGGRITLDGARLEHRVELFEEASFNEPIDFAYSNDVMEHVDNPATVYDAAHRVLRPGGCFVNNIDLAGHNAYSNPKRPLDFLTCPDWLWSLLSSHIVTTNRVRYSEFVATARANGFDVAKEDVIIKADPHYLRELRPKLLERYRRLSDDDLSVVQVRLVTSRQRPAKSAADLVKTVEPSAEHAGAEPTLAASAAPVKAPPALAE